jgi:hypothetical protein
MTSRVVIGFAESADPADIREDLRACGVLEVRGPTDDLPCVLVATVTADWAPEEIVARIAAIDGVEYAERENLYQAFD